MNNATAMVSEPPNHHERRDATESPEDRIPAYPYEDLIPLAATGILVLLNLTGVFTNLFGIDTAIIGGLILGIPIVFSVATELVEKRHVSAEVTVATAFCAALALREYVTAAEVVFIAKTGEALENLAVLRTKSALISLLKLAPRRAHVRRDGGEVEVDADEVAAGEVVIVRPGERIPVDGVVLGGNSTVDESALTGESVPVEKQTGAQVLTGSINQLGAIEVCAERVGEETTLARVIRLVEEAEEQQPPAVRVADRYVAYFVPVVFIASALTIWLARDWYRTLAVVVVACPCAFILATPSAVVCTIGRLARLGILVKGGVHLEQLATVNCIAIDKTGTLTEGRLTLSEVVTFDGMNREEVLRLAAVAERRSEHIVAKLIVEEAQRVNDTIVEPANFVVHPGAGVEAQVNGDLVRVGSMRWLADEGVGLSAEVVAAVAACDRRGETTVLVASNENCLGLIALRDRLREDAAETIAGLRKIGIEELHVLTGDREAVARAIAKEAGIESVDAQLLPDAKVARIRELQRQGFKVAMIGDGINDAPSLAAADVGIAMGKAGSAIAAQAADLVMMREQLIHLPELIRISRAMVKTIHQNILGFGLGFNGLAMLVGSFGGFTTLYEGTLGRVINLSLGATKEPVLAAITHQVGSLAVLLNSLRLFIARGAAPAVDAWLQAVPATVVAHRRKLLRGGGSALIVIYLSTFLFIVRADEVGVVQRFGKLIGIASPGLHAKLPFPIDFVTNVQTQRARVIEMGFRTKPVGGAPPPAYEWESQHGAGDYDKVGDEAIMLTGDENLADVNVTVQYRASDAAKFLFAASDVEAVVRTVAEAVVREVVGRTPLDSVLTTGRAEMERDCMTRIAPRFHAQSLGVEIISIRFQDVHPPIEVVPAFREVANAHEEKSKLINEAEAYRNEQIPTARGEAEKRLREALAFRIGRVNRAYGDANRFVQRLSAYRGAPEVTRTRLYWEAIEQVLPGRKKLILDKKNGGRRQLLLLEPGNVSLNLATGEVQKQPKPESPSSPPQSKAKPFGPEEE